MKWILFSFIVCHVTSLGRCADVDCLPDDNKCSCTFTDGRGTVDITSLGNKDNTPRFKDVYDKTNQVYYSYNPCGGFNEGECADAAACVLTSDKSEQDQIGDAAKRVFKFDSGKVVVGYISGTRVFKLTQVHLTCEENACDPIFEPIGQALDSYEMKMTTVCACPGMCDGNGAKRCHSTTGTGALSIGLIIIIVLVCLVIIYMVIGSVYMKFRHKKTGTDVIIHRDIIIKLPVFVKAGFLFTFRKCLPNRCSESYTNM